MEIYAKKRIRQPRYSNYNIKFTHTVTITLTTFFSLDLNATCPYKLSCTMAGYILEKSINENEKLKKCFRVLCPIKSDLIVTDIAGFFFFHTIS